MLAEADGELGHRSDIFILRRTAVDDDQAPVQRHGSAQPVSTGGVLNLRGSGACWSMHRQWLFVDVPAPARTQSLYP
jgi:hypothetical protein